MPTFGPPHGYGSGQRDPPSSAAVVFSYVDNVHECIALLLHDKGGAAYGRLHGSGGYQLPAQATTWTHLHKNIFLRETVREYNGGIEFKPNAAGTAWAIVRGTNYDNRNYPNHVLQTAVAYEPLYPTQNPNPPPAQLPPQLTELPYLDAYFWAQIPP
jgi:hypothetical protein